MTMTNEWQQVVKGSSLELWCSPQETFMHFFSPRLYSVVNELKWHNSAKGYAVARQASLGVTSLHRLALGLTPGEGYQKQVDHIDGDTYNSRDENLRIVSSRKNQHNMKNQSVYGIGIILDREWYRVRIFMDGRHIFAPSFAGYKAAVRCRDAYLNIALAIDDGIRSVPTREELKQIADRERRV